ncbi:hypothetical protein LOK49_LG02G01956 [Camellia lanceoleosa]|uniref:Uncharacterized protein n=1 Tax=Camellia lanceoleosa TaxID=1840588 RepID=A0ACC0ISU5_9ERIC|nr:hypothetical protein LOK49_LG02G01956 [Camellia lanceoleosa]
MGPGGPGGPPGWGPPPGGPIPGPPPGLGFFGGFCNAISACLSFLCCCWLFQDCFGGPMGPPMGPPPP